MSGGEDFIYRPVIEGMCREESLWDGTLNLWRIMLMNEALDVRAENRARIQDHLSQDHGD